MSEENTIQVSMNKHVTNVLLDCVSFRLEKWPGGHPAEQEELAELKRLLTAASLEFQLDW